MMTSKPIALELDPGNLVWLKAQALATGHRSVSDVVNDVIAGARGGAAKGEKVESVVGKVRIAEEDPGLDDADASIRRLFEESQERYPPG
jgi:hypothetical protein